jgi:chemotaxis signal transduction protein
LNIADIAEIKEVASVTTVPGAPDAIAGLTDLRGRIVTLVDLARLFALPGAAIGSRLAVQFSEPLSHLGLLVAASVHDVRTDAAHDLSWGPPAPGGPNELVEAEPLGREIVLDGAHTAFLLDVNALAIECSTRVRGQFRVTA